MTHRKHHGDTAAAGKLACGRRSCMAEAAPESLYCPRHAQELVLGLEECRVGACDERIPFGSLWCGEHAELRRLGRISAAGEPVPAALWPQHVPPPAPEATSITLKPPPPERKRGGALAIPHTHVDPPVSLPPARGEELEAAAPLAGEGSGSAPPHEALCRKGCGRERRPAGPARGRYANLCAECYDEQIELSREAAQRRERNRNGNNPTPEIRDEEPPLPPEAPAPDLPEDRELAICTTLGTHPAHPWETRGGKPCWCDGVNPDGSRPYDPQRPAPTLEPPPAYLETPAPLPAPLIEPLPEIGAALRDDESPAWRTAWLTLERQTPEERIADARADAICAAYRNLARSHDQDHAGYEDALALLSAHGEHAPVPVPCAE